MYEFMSPPFHLNNFNIKRQLKGKRNKLIRNKETVKDVARGRGKQ